jgi:hypothetical protein
MTKTADLHNQAFIRDDALILHFDTAQTPFVARFDLDSLVQANFEVTNKDGGFALTLRDFSGASQNVAQFAAKADAHQALYAILQALLSHARSTPEKSCGTGSRVWCMFKCLLGLALILGLLYAAFIWFMVRPDAVPLKTPAASSAAAMAPAPVATVPEGEPVDMNSLLPQQH